MKITCHNCGVEGHKSTYCQEEKLNEVERAKIMLMNPSTQIQNLNVTCIIKIKLAPSKIKLGRGKSGRVTWHRQRVFQIRSFLRNCAINTASS